MSYFDTLKQEVNDNKTILVDAARTIRDLIAQRNAALAAAHPADVAATEAQAAQELEAANLLGDLKNRRDDLGRAISEAQAKPGPTTQFPQLPQKGATKMATKAPHKAGVDLQILENGTVRYTISFTDANGQATSLPAGTPPITGVSSDPDLTLAPDPADTSGFNLQWIGTAGTTAATGIVASFSVTATKPDGTSVTITGAADPVDVVPAPPGFPTTMVVAEA